MTLKQIQALHDLLEDLLPQYWQDLAQLVAIPSVQGPAEPGAPYGPGPKAALAWVLDRAKAMGFETVNLDHKVGYAQWSPDPNQATSGAGYYGIFGHVDVVPAGQGWQQDPWILTKNQEQARYQGRGVLDNKGPILANLYAVYALKCLGYHFRHPIRVVFGTNEETGFGCIQHYLAQEAAPLFGWTPDCKWPVVYGERGRLRVAVSVDADQVASLFDFVNAYLLTGTKDGRELGIAYEDQDFGRMMLRGYQLGLTQGRPWVAWSMAYPGTCSQEEILAHIRTHLPEGAQLEVLSHWAPVLKDKQSPYIEALQQVYNQVTGQALEPVTTTGGTYAKFVPNLVAYGPSFPSQRDIAHLPHEWLGIEDLETDLKIYSQALLALWQLEQEVEEASP